MTDELMTIRQMCDAFAVTPRTLRFYEAKELLFPLRRGTQRLFSRGDRARLTLILRGLAWTIERSLGITSEALTRAQGREGVLELLHERSHSIQSAFSIGSIHV